MRKVKVNIIMILGLLLSADALADSANVNPKQLIFEHIQDSYWWHITTIDNHHLSLYLPVILYSRSKGWQLFSSARVDHNASYKGFYISEEGKYKGKIVELNEAGEETRPVDLSLTKTAFAIILNSAIMLVLFLGMASRYRRKSVRDVPGGFVGAMEMFIMSVEDNIIRENIGKDYARYSPYLLTAFFFIFISNIMGLIPIFPGGANVTGNISVTLFLALCTMLAINLFGNKEYRKEILWPDVPLWMKIPIPLMPLIELFGVISKPFALTIRLFANMTAGHAVIIALTCMVFVTVKMGAGIHAGMTFFSVILSMFMFCLEILVAYIQAYVFTMLSAVFIGLSRQEHH